MPDPRLDISNSSTNQQAADVGLCGQTDLRTGRSCILPVRHDGPCDFAGAQAVEAVVEDRNPSSGR